MSEGIPQPDIAGLVYFQTIDELLRYEQARKAALEAKALSVVTTSGTLVTLLLGFAGLNGSKGGPPLPSAASWPLVAAMAVFVLAALTGLAANLPVSHSPLSVKRDLKRMVHDDLWQQPRDVGLQAVAEFRVGEIDRWRDANGKKAKALRIGIGAEILAVALLAVAASVILLTSRN